MAAITPIPTAAQFKARFPVFANVTKEVVDLAIAEAMTSVDDTWIEADQVHALFYLVAHLLTMEGALAASPGAASAVITRGPVTSVRVGDVSTSYGAAAASGTNGSAIVSWLESTEWGRRYLGLLRRSFPPILVV